MLSFRLHMQVLIFHQQLWFYQVSMSCKPPYTTCTYGMSTLGIYLIIFYFKHFYMHVHNARVYLLKFLYAINIFMNGSNGQFFLIVVSRVIVLDDIAHRREGICIWVEVVWTQVVKRRWVGRVAIGGCEIYSKCAV